MSKIQITKKDTLPETHQILGFDGYYHFLSNDYSSWVYLDGIAFPSVSTAYQASRTEDEKLRLKISNVNDAEQFTKLAMSIQNPSDWAERKQKVMTNLVRDKFKRNKQILEKLMGTKQKQLINNMKRSGFNQEYWGVYDGKGKNMLGKILMSIRQQFNKGIDTKQWLLNNLNLETDIKMCPSVVLNVYKDGKKIQKLALDKEKTYYLFGSLKTTDFYLQNPTISRNHASIYFSDLQVMIVDLNSTHGTYLKRHGQQKQQLEGLIGYRLYKDDVIQFGTSARDYIVQINRTEVQNYINEQQKDLNEDVQRSENKLGKATEYSNLNKQQVQELLGMDKRCILVEGLKQTDSYSKIKDYFSKWCRVKYLKMKVNKKTGRCEGVGVLYLQSNKSCEQIMKNKSQISYRVRGIGEKEAEKILLGEKVRSRSRSQSREGKKQKSRERSREKR